MIHKLALLLAVAVLAAPLYGCQSKKKAAVFDPHLADLYFPLVPHAEWTYKVKSESQRSTYVITDTVIGKKYVPSLNVTGDVVSEYYDMERGGDRPIIYVHQHGYFDRLSGLNYTKDNANDDIEAPAWGRSDDGEFLPQRLVPNLSWDSKSLPFGNVAGAFDIKESHKTFFDPGEIVVPAGRFSNCIRVETTALYEGGEYSKKVTPALTYEDWYAPNVGLVKTITYEGGPEGHVMEQVELLHSKLPPKTAAQAPSAQQAAAASTKTTLAGPPAKAAAN